MAKIRGAQILRRSDLTGATGFFEGGFIFEEDERHKCEDLAEQLFDINVDLLAELWRHLRRKIDQMERRTELASSVVSRFQDHWLDLVPKGWSPPEINGQPMPMPSDDYDDSPK